PSAVAVVQVAAGVEVAPVAEAGPMAGAAAAVEAAPMAGAAAAVEASPVAPAAVAVAPERPALERHLPTGHVSAWPQPPAPAAPVREVGQPAARGVPAPPARETPVR